MRRSVVVPVACAAVLLGTAACSGGSDGDPTPAPPPTSVVRTGAPPSLPGAIGAAADLNGLRCVHDARGTWKASGTLRNSSGRSVDYAVSVFIVRSRTGTVLGQASRVVRVAAGGAKAVALDRVYGNPRTAGLTCVPHVERARA